MGTKHPTEKLGRKPKAAHTTTPVEKKQATEKKADFKPAKKPAKKPSRFSKTPYIGPLLDTVMGLNRNVKLAASLVLVLILVSLLMVAIGGDNDEAPALASEETVSETALEPGMAVSSELARIEGTVETLDESGDWTDAPSDLELVEGTALRTVGATSRAVVRFDDGSELRIDANSEIRLGALNENRVVVEQINGYTYSRVVKSQFIVKTEKAQYEALGTAFRTVVSGDEDAVEVFHSKVVETTTNTDTEEGERLIVDSRVNPVKNGSVEKLDIEEIKKDPFITWNRDRDQENEAFKDDLGFLKDFDGPTITITDPKENSTVLLEPDASKATVTIKGSVERFASLTVQSKSLSGSEPVDVSVSDDGSFTTPVLQAPFGSSVFEFIAKDRVGNTTELNIRYTLQRKSSTVGSGSIILSAEIDAAEENIDVSWGFSGSVTADDGIKVVYSTSSNPTYDDDDSVLVTSGNTTSISLSGLKKDKKYYIRACVYDAEDDECSNYSDQTSVTTPE